MTAEKVKISVYFTPAAVCFLANEWDRGDVMAISEQVTLRPIRSRCLQLYEHAEGSEGTIDARRLTATAELALGLLLCPSGDPQGSNGGLQAEDAGCHGDHHTGH